MGVLQVGSQPPSSTDMVLASAAECCKYLGGAVAPHVTDLMALCLRELASPEATNRRNAAFCSGLLCAGGGPAASPYPHPHPHPSSQDACLCV